MLEHTRAVTLQEIENLSVEQLDLIMPSGGNSIGALLKTYGIYRKSPSAYFISKIVTLQKEELEIWEDALYLGKLGERFMVMKYSIMYNFCKVFEKSRSKYLE